jgi:hypothetical protein
VSFDIFVQGFKSGDRWMVDRDVFVAALGSSLKRVGTNFNLETTDGGWAEVYGLDEDPFDGCMFALHGDLSPLVADRIVAAGKSWEVRHLLAGRRNAICVPRSSHPLRFAVRPRRPDSGPL